MGKQSLGGVEDEHALPANVSPEKALRVLLVDLFTPQEVLRAYLHETFGAAVGDELPSSYTPAWLFAFSAVLTLKRKELINRKFFAGLIAERQFRKADIEAVEGRWQKVPQGEVVWGPRLMLVGLATAIGLGVLLRASPPRWPVVVLLSLVTFTAFAWAPRPWLTRSSWRALRWNRRLGLVGFVLMLMTGVAVGLTRRAYSLVDETLVDRLPIAMRATVDPARQGDPRLRIFANPPQRTVGPIQFHFNDLRSGDELRRITIRDVKRDKSAQPFLHWSVLDSMMLPDAAQRLGPEVSWHAQGSARVSDHIPLATMRTLYSEWEMPPTPEIGLIVRNLGGAAAENLVVWPFENTLRRALAIDAPSSLTLGTLQPDHAVVVIMPIAIETVGYATQRSLMRERAGRDRHALRRMSAPLLEFIPDDLQVRFQVRDPQTNERVRWTDPLLNPSGDVIQTKPGKWDRLLQLGFSEAFAARDEPPTVTTFSLGRSEMAMKTVPIFKATLDPDATSCLVGDLAPIGALYEFQLLLQFADQPGVLKATIDFHDANDAVLGSFKVQFLSSGSSLAPEAAKPGCTVEYLNPPQ